MQIVIDIDDELYKRIKKNCYIYEEEAEKVALSIIGGIPLPKRHGDLIDRKELIQSGLNKGFCDWYDEIGQASTIIEEDKESEEE
jgi:hypothetical protein